jgi:hypothetical protein
LERFRATESCFESFDPNTLGRASVPTAGLANVQRVIVMRLALTIAIVGGSVCVSLPFFQVAAWLGVFALLIVLAACMVVVGILSVIFAPDARSAKRFGQF